MPERPGSPVDVQRGSATLLPFAQGTFDAVVTDPPYDEMIAYADSSDLFYAWLKRALSDAWPELAITSEPTGAQEKALEIIVKRTRGISKSEYTDHRTRSHYDTNIAAAFAEARRTVKDDGVVTIVFGHGEPEVWQRLLASVGAAGLVMTASWPANTESGGQQGKANIETTLTMACRPAPANRTPGRKGAVEGEIKAEIRRRYPDWERWGLAPADMLMAAAGPAMEIVGGYSEVLDSRGEPVDIHTFLPLARSAVQEAMAVQIDHRPLDTFDARTRFALWWARLYGRHPQAKSELRWQALASSMDLDAVRDLVDGDKGVALVSSANFQSVITSESAVIDVALTLAAASEQGVAAMGEVLAASHFEADDQFLWAAIQFLADRLPDSDPDSIAFHRVLRARVGIATAAQNVAEAVRTEREQRDLEDRQIKLL
jgi:adenine-specific DNA methylase